MFFLMFVLMVTTLLLCYAGYIFLIVDKRQAKQVLSNPELFSALDDKDYNFELPSEIDEYDTLRDSKPTDKRALPVALLKRAMADIPRIEQLEKDHPRMARLFNRGLLPFSVWEQLLEAEAMMDTEVHEVQEEAEKLHKGWGQGVFSQAYQMLRRERDEETTRQQRDREAAVLSISFTTLSGTVVQMAADGRSVTQQTQLAIRKEDLNLELAFKTEVNAEIAIGAGEDRRSFSCTHELTLDKEKEKQWMQIGQDPTGLRLQVKFHRRSHGLKTSFSVADVRATVPATATVTDVTMAANEVTSTVATAGAEAS